MKEQNNYNLRSKDKLLKLKKIKRPTEVKNLFKLNFKALAEFNGKNDWENNKNDPKYQIDQLLEAEEEVKKYVNGLLEVDQYKVFNMAKSFLEKEDFDNIESLYLLKLVPKKIDAVISVLHVRLESIINAIKNPMIVENENEFPNEEMNKALNLFKAEVEKKNKENDIMKLEEMKGDEESKKMFDDILKKLEPKKIEEMILIKENEEKEKKEININLENINNGNYIEFNDVINNDEDKKKDKKFHISDYDKKYEKSINLDELKKREIANEKIYDIQSESFYEKINGYCEKINKNIEVVKNAVKSNQDQNILINDLLNPSKEKVKNILERNLSINSVLQLVNDYYLNIQNVSVQDLFMATVFSTIVKKQKHLCDNIDKLNDAVEATWNIQKLIKTQSSNDQKKNAINKVISGKYVSKKEWANLDEIKKAIKNICEFKQFPNKSIWNKWEEEKKLLYLKEKSAWFKVRANKILEDIRSAKYDSNLYPKMINNLLYYYDKDSSGFFIKDFQELWEKLDLKLRQEVCDMRLRLKVHLDNFSKRKMIRGLIIVMGEKILNKGTAYYTKNLVRENLKNKALRENDPDGEYTKKYNSMYKDNLLKKKRPLDTNRSHFNNKLNDNKKRKNF